MKILENNCNKPLDKPAPILQTYKVQCERCGSILEIEDSDLISIEMSCVAFDCPCCSKRSLIDNMSEYITYNTIKYPDNFWRYKDNGDHDSKFLNDSTKYINEAIKCLYEDLKDVSIQADDEEVGRRYWMGTTELLMFKHRNESSDESMKDIEYLYDIQIVKPLADAEIADVHKIIYEGDNICDLYF